MRGRQRSYLRAASDSSTANNLNSLPQYYPGLPLRTSSKASEVSISRLKLPRLPRLISPVPLNIGEMPKSHRLAAQVGAAALLVACTLLLRPHNWGAWGGLEYVPQMIRYPRIGLIAIGICIALAAGALAWGAAGHKRLGTLALVPLGLLAAAISARIGGPV